MFARTAIARGISPFTMFVIESKGTLTGAQARTRCAELARQFKNLSASERTTLNRRAKQVPAFRRINDRIRFNRLVNKRYPTMMGTHHDRMRRIAKIWKWKKMIGSV